MKLPKEINAKRVSHRKVGARPNEPTHAMCRHGGIAKCDAAEFHYRGIALSSRVYGVADGSNREVNRNLHHPCRVQAADEGEAQALDRLNTLARCPLLTWRRDLEQGAGADLNSAPHVGGVTGRQSLFSPRIEPCMSMMPSV